jgi:hypothetical protein
MLQWLRRRQDARGLAQGDAEALDPRPRARRGLRNPTTKETVPLEARGGPCSWRVRASLGPPNGSYPMGMQILRRLFKTADVSPIAQSPTLPSDWADFSDRLCVLASQGPGGAESRGDKLYSCEDARLLASELNSEWPGSSYRASRATTHEIKAHAVQAARLIARERRYPRFPKASSRAA